MWWSDFTEPHLKLGAKKEAKGRVIEDGRLYCCHEMVKDRGAETQEKQQEPAVTPGAATGLSPGGRARGVWDRPAASVEWAQESKAGGQGHSAGASRCPADAWRRPHTWPGREGPSKDREAESPGTLRVRRLLQGGVSIMAPPCPGFAVIKTPLASRLHLWIPARVNAGKSSSLSSVPYTQTYNILNIPNLCKNWLSFPSFLIKDLKDKT